MRVTCVLNHLETVIDTSAARSIKLWIIFAFLYSVAHKTPFVVLLRTKRVHILSGKTRAKCKPWSQTEQLKCTMTAALIS